MRNDIISKMNSWTISQGKLRKREKANRCLIELDSRISQVSFALQVIAFTCCCITVVLLLGSLGDASWVQSEGWREGLFTQCVKAGAPTPLPFGADPTPGCRRAHSAGYVRGAAALMIIGFMTDFFGTLLTGLGLRSTDPNKKYKYYRVAIYAFTAAGKNFNLDHLITFNIVEIGH